MKYLFLLLLLPYQVLAQPGFGNNTPVWPVSFQSSGFVRTISPANGSDISLIISTNSAPGTIWYLAPGVYNVVSWMKCPTNGAIIGSGAGATIIVSTLANGIPTPIIACSDNGYVSDLTISNSVAESTPSSCLGTHFNNCTVVGTQVVSGSGGYTNFLGERLILYGGSDTYYNRHTNSCQGELRYCQLYGGWDIVTAFNNPNDLLAQHKFLFRYCSFVHINTASHANPKDIFVASFTAKARFSAWFCYFFKTNGIQNDDYFLNVTDTPSTQLADFHFCNFTNVVPATTDWAITSGAASPASFEGCNIQTKNYNDGLASQTGLFFGTNTVNSLIFAGDTLNPNRVGLWVSDNSGQQLISSAPINNMTNLGSAAVDFTIPESVVPTAVSLTFTAPIGLTSTNGQHIIQWVTNSAAGTITITPPANARFVGSTTVTRLSKINWDAYGLKWTNGIITAIF